MKKNKQKTTLLFMRDNCTACKTTLKRSTYEYERIFFAYYSLDYAFVISVFHATGPGSSIKM